MKITKLLLILVFLSNGLYAQTPSYIRHGIELIGIKHIEDQGTILLSKGANRSVNINLLDTSLNEAWSTNYSIRKAKGYSFHKLEIHHSNAHLFICDHFENEVSTLILDLKTGKVEEELILDSSLNSIQDKLPLEVINNQLVYVDIERDVKKIIKVGTDLKMHKEELKVDLAFTTENHIMFSNGKQLLQSYKEEADHSALNLKFIKLDLNTGDTAIVEHELELEHTAYTYNSIVDKSLMSFYKTADHIYAIGKLDHKFRDNYPSTRNSEAILGFWIAKFSLDLELLYFSEIPFQYFEGLVTNDMVIKASVIDLKEDLNGNCFVSINEMKGVLYGKKYVVNIDTAGKYTTFIGGQDAYHFFEYNERGLRRASNKLKLRLMNDDWSFYATSYLHLLKYSPNHHSTAIKGILKLSAQKYVPYSDKVYTFTARINGHLVFEYLDKKGGTLAIYRMF